MDRETRVCPYCGETIYAEAAKCRWCGEMLRETPPDEAKDSGYPVREEHPSGAVAILIFGILAWAVCFLFGIVAWIMGSDYARKCEEKGLQPEGTAVAGKILGMVNVILTLVVIGFVVFMVVAGAAFSGGSSTP
ncbi:MAG: DUF4190 domain-containing protein [Planctomycetota bacterium]|jgi:hypothetical protein